MSKVKLLITMFIAVLSVGALASASASAAPAEWMLSGKTLAEDGLTSAALRTTAKADESGVLSAGGLTITCTGNLEGRAAEIANANTIKAIAIIFTNCKGSPKTCTVPTTIGTVPIEGEATLDGALAVKGVVRPQSGTVFTTIAITGIECAVGGTRPVAGDVEVLMPEGQDERTDQLLTINQTTGSGLLKLGSEGATLKGAALLLLASGTAWSFL